MSMKKAKCRKKYFAWKKPESFDWSQTGHKRADENVFFELFMAF